MQWFQELSNFLSRNSTVAMAALSIAAVVLLLICLYLIASVISLKRRYDFLLRHEDTQNLGTVFSEYSRRVDELQRDEKDLRVRLNDLSRAQEPCVQRVGVVRFDAFADVGGQQSYVVALLDAHDDGVVLSSLYSRNETRTYAKSVVGGRSTHHFSGEEEQAVNLARQNSSGAVEPLRR